MMLLQSTEVALPLWMVVTGGVALFLSPFLTALLTWWLSRPKTSVEVTGQKQKNIEQNYKNFDFGNDVLNDAAAEIDRLRKIELQLGKENYDQKSEIQMLGLQKAELRGQVALALQQKEEVLTANKLLEERIARLITEVAHEREICQQQIQDMKEAHEAQHREIMGKLAKIEKFLHEKGIEMPVEL